MDQYNEFIYMKDFGAPMYSLIFALENNNIKYMEYREFQSQIHIESNLVTSIEDNKRYYTAYISGISDSPFTKNMISANVPLYTYLENGKEEALPLFFNYDNCKQCGDLFEISINIDNRDISFFLEKNKIAIYFPANKSITIYQIDDMNESEKNFRKPIETYQFTKKGFYCSNIKEKQYSCVYDETNVFFDLFLKKRNPNINFFLLDLKPTSIYYKGKYQDEVRDLFSLHYSNEGIVDKCFLSENELTNLCRYEYMHNSRLSYKEINSIHVHLFDTFNYDYIDEPLKYWALDHYTESGSVIEFTRYVYKLEPEKVNPLIFELNNDLDRPKILWS